MGLSHAAKFKYLTDYTTDVRNQLLDWLNGRHLHAQVESVDPVTAFNTLFFTATPEVKQALVEHPAVVKIAEDYAMPVDLMWQNK